MEDQLQHYGVVGMKWGRRRVNSMATKNNKKHDQFWDLAIKSDTMKPGIKKNMTENKMARLYLDQTKSADKARKTFDKHTEKFVKEYGKLKGSNPKKANAMLQERKRLYETAVSAKTFGPQVRKIVESRLDKNIKRVKAERKLIKYMLALDIMASPVRLGYI